MRKKSTQLFKALVISSLLTGNAMSQSIPEVLFYKFNEAGTNVINYASGASVANDTATILGSITQGTSNFGLCNGVLKGSNASSNANYLNTNWSPNLGAGAWTISFRSAGISNNSTLYYVFGDVNTNSFRCFTNGVAGPNNFILRGAGLTDVYANGAAQATATMTTFVYDPILNNVKAYVNGVLVSTVAQGTPNLTGTGPLKVMGYNANIGAPVGGEMDEFRIYNRALDATEVLALYTPPSQTNVLGPDFSSCNGSATIGLSNSTTNNPIWSTGATNASITVNASGTYTFKDSSTCLVVKDTITVTVGNATSASQTINRCFGQSYTINGNTYTASGTYNDTLSSIAGCDSIIVTNLSIAAQIASSQTITRCFGQSYTINGNTYTSSGTYTDTLSAINSCDSIVTTNLTIDAQITSSQSITRCFGQSYTFNGNTYTTTGTYSDTLTAANGCDSIVTTNLTIGAQITSSQSINRCFGQSYTFNGNTYTTSGTYSDTLTSANGCDSIVTTNLAISSAITSSVSASICQGQTYPFKGVVYNTTGTYTDTLTSSGGCDSIVTLNLTVLPAVNVTTTLNNLTITSGANNATYQWINCNTNTNIPSATNQSYTATANGSYAVIVTQNGCSDTSACVSITSIGLNKVVANRKISIYPNPSNGVFTIATDLNTEINIYDALGREVLKQTITAGKTTIDLNKEVSGVYYVKMKNVQTQSTNRIVVYK